MHDPFFPNLPFAVAFAVVLAAGLGYAARADWKRLVVPKWLSLGLLAAVVVFNIIRGAWRAGVGIPGWTSGPGDVILGGLDGLLFALAGFGVGFGLFFVFWFFQIAGGGDVKLVAAAGAWLGPWYLLGAVLFSVPFVLILVLFRMGYRIMRGNINQLATARAPGGTAGSARRREMSYSLSFALGAVVIVLALLIRYTQSLQGQPPPAG